jgi:KDO2-lipid IV(A) lauroyltransferase
MKSRIKYSLIYSAIYAFHLLPFWVLYRISDFMYFLVFYIIKYRKAIVFKNLRNSFPEKDADEIRKVAKKYYAHLCDTFIETFACLSKSKKQMAKRFVLKDQDILMKYYNQGKSPIAITAHYGNWEWLTILPLHTAYHIVIIYKPLTNKYFDQLIKTTRQKWGLDMITKVESVRKIYSYINQGKKFLTVYLSDQTPNKSEVNYRTEFLNQDTPVFLGSEKIARKTGQPVIYLNIQKVKRGYYEVSIDDLFDKPLETADYEITNSHVKTLEKYIKRKPEYWLWSHRRWKHTRKVQDHSDLTT